MQYGGRSLYGPKFGTFLWCFWPLGSFIGAQQNYPWAGRSSKRPKKPNIRPNSIFLSGNSNKSTAATAADEAGGNEVGGEGSGGGGGEEESVVFSDAVLMTETERILGLIDSVEARGTSVSMPRPPGSQAEDKSQINQING